MVVPPRLLFRDPRGHLLYLDVVALATPRERELGYMHQRAYPAVPSLLFVYPRAALVSIWMSNTHLPLDVIFIDALGVITKVHRNARPFDETPISSDVPVRYVLEVPAGWADMFGLRVGTGIGLQGIAGSNLL